MTEADKVRIAELERELADIRRTDAKKKTAKKPLAEEKAVKKKAKR